jgi:hypothetical protein
MRSQVADVEVVKLKIEVLFRALAFTFGEQAKA